MRSDKPTRTPILIACKGPCKVCAGRIKHATKHGIKEGSLR